MNFSEFFRKGNVVYINDPEGNAVPFVPDVPLSAAGYAIVVVSIAEVERFFKLSSLYVGPNGEGEIPGRYAGFAAWYHGKERWHRGDQAIQMPRVCFAGDKRTRNRYQDDPRTWTVEFSNGRHRFAWLRDQGFREIPVVVPKNQLGEFQQRFGWS